MEGKICTKICLQLGNKAQNTSNVSSTLASTLLTVTNMSHYCLRKDIVAQRLEYW